jgi:hypothetical protein
MTPARGPTETVAEWVARNLANAPELTADQREVIRRTLGRPERKRQVA